MTIKNFVSFISVIMLALCAGVAMAGQTFLPMAIKGQIPNPSVFADRIEESLRADPTGGTTIRGANVDPNGVLTAVRVAGGTVGSLDGLAPYLRSLGEGDMPRGIINLSRAASPVGHMVDTSQGWARGAHPGERGWYDMNTGLLILAGDCSNSPTTHISRGNAATQPIVASAKPQPKRDPYAGFERCEFGSEDSYYVTVHLMEPRAAEDQCAKEHLIPQDGRVKQAGNWRLHDNFSEVCGGKMGEFAKAGQLSYATTRRPVDVVFADATQEYPIFTGFLTGDGNFETTDIASKQYLASNGKAVRIPDQYRAMEGDVVAYVDQQLPSGIGKYIKDKEFHGGCHAVVYTAVDGYYKDVKPQQKVAGK